jgi:heme a synthase
MAKLTEQQFIRWTKVTLVLVFFLILVGGIVRSTGSGLGCPDWPRCFGQWIPPTHESELPQNYKEIFKVAGKEIADFDAFKTWTEYINRLIGAFIGLSILVMAIFSFAYKSRDRVIVWGSWAAFVLVGFQGWIGAIVVKTHLAGYMITIHMFLALCLVCLILWLYRRAQGVEAATLSLEHQKTLRILFILSTIQLLLGTQLREAIDVVIKSNPGLLRESWVEQTGWIFYIHRSFSLLLLFFHVKCIRALYSQDKAESHRLNFSFIVTLLSGIGLAYFSFPAFLQPIHLLFALLIVTQYFDCAYFKIRKSSF